MKIAIALFTMMMVFACSEEKPNALHQEAPVKRDISKPTFANVGNRVLSQCGPCHLEGKSQGGFNAETYENVLLSVVPGNADMSSLVFAIGPYGNMPPKGPKVSAELVELVSKWVNEGAQKN